LVVAARLLFAVVIVAASVAIERHEFRVAPAAGRWDRRQ
jgi:hypothetical protein